MHLAPLIHDLAVILAVAGLISLIFQRIRQPVVLGYILAGIVIGPHTPPFQLITDVPSIQTWAELGVIFLMFSLGLEFSFRKLTRVGGSAVVTAGMEVAFFLPVGYLAGRAFGWPHMDSIFLGAMLAISSTTIIIKALDELKLKKHRFAELIFGALIVEDLIAILLLVGLSTVAMTDAVSGLTLLTAAGKLILVVGGWFLTGYFVVPRFMRYVGRIGNDEILTILSLGLCLALVVFANHFKYSSALGAFIMGSILAETSVLHRIERNLASLRDLFGAVFFVSIGLMIDPHSIWEHRWAVLALSLLTIVGKILSTGLGALVSGQSVRNSVQVGFGLAQIGEFSFIIATLGQSLDVISDFLYPIAVAVSLVTTFTTPYLIRLSGPAAERIEAMLPERIRIALSRYAAAAEARRTGDAANPAAQRSLLRWGLNALTVSLIFVIGSDALLPVLTDMPRIGPERAPYIGWLAALTLSAPFIWAMFSTFRAPGGKRPVERWGSLAQSAAWPVIRVLATITMLAGLGALSAAYFPGRSVLWGTGLAVVFTLVLFYRQLDSAYHWFEGRFLSTFQGSGAASQHEGEGDGGPETDAQGAYADASEPRTSRAFGHLAPWDAHLVSVEVHPNSKLILQKISDAALRVRFGVNIVAIRRGRQTIVTPLPSEILLPMDELILLGTDEQVARLNRELEPADLEGVDPADVDRPPAAYEVRQKKLGPFSSLIGQSIRQSGLRERYRAMVVGIERDGRRNINPDSDLVLREADVLWIAGDRDQLTRLVSELGAARRTDPTATLSDKRE